MSSSQEAYLLSDKLIKRLHLVHRSMNLPGEAEDFISDYRLAILEGKASKQTLDQFAIDYLRNKLGRTGSKVALHNAGELLDEHAKSVDFIPSDEFINLRDQLSGLSRAVLVLIYKYGFDQLEIAEVFGCSECNVSLAKTKMLEEIRSFYSEDV